MNRSYVCLALAESMQAACIKRFRSCHVFADKAGATSKFSVTVSMAGDASAPKTQAHTEYLETAPDGLHRKSAVSCHPIGISAFFTFSCG